MGVGIKYSKPFVCICKHTATRIRIWQGCPAEVGNLMVSVSWPSALHCNPCPTPCSPGNVNPTPAPLMDITLRQDWSATLYTVHPMTHIPIVYSIPIGLINTGQPTLWYIIDLLYIVYSVCACFPTCRPVEIGPGLLNGGALMWLSGGACPRLCLCC